MNGYIKLHRKLLEWGWYKDSVVKDVWIHLLMTANWKNTTYQGHEIHPGETVIGLKSLAEQLGFSIQQIRTALNKLEKTGEINKRATNKFTVVTIANWESYQFDDDENNTDLTNEQQTNNKPITNEQQHLKKERIKEYKNQSISHSISNSIDRGLSPEELDRLTDHYSDVEGLLDMVEKKIRLRKNSTPVRNMYGYVIACASEAGWPTREEAEAKRAERNANLKVLQDFEEEARREREARVPLSAERKQELMQQFGIGNWG